MNKIRWGRVLSAGLVFLVIAFIVREVEIVLTMGYYQDPAYFPVWSSSLMPNAGPPPTSFLVTSLLFTFVTGLVVAVFYELVKGILPKSYWQKTVNFTGLTFALALVFFTLPVYLIINLPVGLQLWWLGSSFMVFLLTSLAFVKILG